jgi:CRISPR-associated protein Cas2
VQIWLVCYDISCDKRRLRAAKWLLRYGQRVQESVFEISTKSDTHFGHMWQGLNGLLDGEDSMRAYPLTQQALQSVRTRNEAKPQPVRYAKVL